MAQRRVLLKMSGEALCKEGGFGIDPKIVLDLAMQVQRALSAGGLQVALVVGGGNFVRGEQIARQGIDRITGDKMGMLATIMNSLALQSALEGVGIVTRVLSAIHVNDVAEPFIHRRCLRHLEKGRVVILAGGTGHPYFSTDTTAALRAVEIGATMLYKATKVRGVYSADPVSDPEAQLYERLSFLDVLQKRLKVMDATAISLCMENKLPILVFSMKEPGNVERALNGERLGTLVE
ncbi:MAG: UMP kinase [Planctomycetes bacterium]|nr:UMP kinase [Planctomycetota bacterium]